MADEREKVKPEWGDVTRTLVIMAHPDDPDITCGGTAALMAKQGIEVTFMILTNGDKGNHNPDLTRDELIDLRWLRHYGFAGLDQPNLHGGLSR